jgi:hypothetical protein
MFFRASELKDEDLFKNGSKWCYFKIYSILFIWKKFNKNNNRRL